MAGSIPFINLKGDESHVVRHLRDACTDVGFFYVKGHDISEAFLEEVMEASKRLFDLPLNEKLALQDKELTRGYTPMEEETLDPENQPERGDTKEGYYLGLDVPKSNKLYNPAKLSGPNVWPSPEISPAWDAAACQKWKDIMSKYFDMVTDLGLQVVRLLALAIGVPEDYFDSSFEAPMAALRLLHYSPEPSAPKNGLFACGAHSDYGMITLLLTDQNKGLQIFTKSGEWIDVPPKRGHFIVNLGDMLERWTNGLFLSTRHRVLIPDDAQRSERYSIPFFFEPNFDTVVQCLEVCCKDPRTGERMPPKYPPTTSGQHLLDKYSQTHADFSPKE
jgi:isopenicillin N synthase-like dioxygenase